MAEVIHNPCDHFGTLCFPAYAPNDYHILVLPYSNYSRTIRWLIIGGILLILYLVFNFPVNL